MSVWDTALVKMFEFLGIPFYMIKNLQEYAQPISFEGTHRHFRLEAPAPTNLSKNISEMINSQMNKIHLDNSPYLNIIKVRNDCVDQIICPQLTIIDNVLRYSKNYMILKYVNNGKWLTLQINSDSINTDDVCYHFCDHELISDDGSAWYAIDFISGNAAINARTITTYYVNKYIKLCCDKMVLLRYMIGDKNDIPVTITRFIIKKLTKIIMYPPFKLKKMS